MTDLDYLRAVLGTRRQLVELALATGQPATRIVQRALALAADPEVQAAHPVECRMVLDLADRRRRARTRAGLVRHG